jgi:hypothetical protein
MDTEAIVEVIPMASGPTTFAVTNQKTKVNRDGIIVLRDVYQIFFPTLLISNVKIIT